MLKLRIMKSLDSIFIRTSLLPKKNKKLSNLSLRIRGRLWIKEEFSIMASSLTMEPEQLILSRWASSLPSLILSALNWKSSLTPSLVSIKERLN